MEGRIEGVLLLPGAMDHLPSADHQEAGVADVGGAEDAVGVGQHHDAGRGGPDHLLLGLLHLQESLRQEPRRLRREEVPSAHQAVAVVHELSAELARVNAVLAPTAHAVGNAQHADVAVGGGGGAGGGIPGRWVGSGVRLGIGRVRIARGGVWAPVVDVPGHEVGVVADLALEDVVDAVPAGLGLGEAADCGDEPGLLLVELLLRVLPARRHPRHQGSGDEAAQAAQGGLHGGGGGGG